MHPCRRGSSYTKKLVTLLGAIKFKVKRVIDRRTGRVSSPILEAMDVKQRKYSRGVRMACVEYATKMSYGDAAMEYETGTGIRVPKRTIHTWVKELAPRLLEAYTASREAREPETNLVIGDSTVVRGIECGEMNQVRVLISGDGGLESLTVNEPWPETQVDVLVSDDEPGLAEAVKAERCQLARARNLYRRMTNL